MYDIPLIHLHELSGNAISKKQIKRRWGDRCAYCGTEPYPGNPLTIDHVVPLSRGGEQLALHNRVSCCLDCNHHKGNKTLDAWYPRQAFFSAFRYARLLRWQYPSIPGWAIAHVIKQNCNSQGVKL